MKKTKNRYWKCGDCEMVGYTQGPESHTCPPKKSHKQGEKNKLKVVGEDEEYYFMKGKDEKITLKRKKERLKNIKLIKR